MILQAVQGANWQRSGGHGNPPKRIPRPDDKPMQVRSGDELRKRIAANRAELVRRRQLREKKKGA
jgi:hypothetical protein